MPDIPAGSKKSVAFRDSVIALHHAGKTQPSTKEGVKNHSWKKTQLPSWWFQPLWKILVKMGIFPK